MITHQPGSEIAGYRIESLIGRGGMAAVYRAEDLRLGRKVALKLLSPQLADSEQFRQRFIRESRLAASLDHPNIVPIYEAGDADGQLFIAMRYVVGSDLKKLLVEQGGRLPVGWTLRLFGQIGDALDSAHRAGLVHRDVKPGNILITTRERRAHAQRDHVYLTDFGLTKRTSELSAGLTGTGHFLGTVDYVSPEQIQGKPVGPATDIYALGCVLYECLTGQLPFRRDDDAALLWAHLVEMPPPISGIRPEVPAAVDTVVARAMAKEPADRYESADELLVGLEQALDVPTIQSPSAGRPSAGRGQTLLVPDPAPTSSAATTTPSTAPAIQVARGDVPVPAAGGPSMLVPTPRTGEPTGAASPPRRRNTTPTRRPPPSGPPPETPPPAAGAGTRRRWWLPLVAGLVVALATAGLVVYLSLQPASPGHGTAASGPRTTAGAPTTRSTPSPTPSPPHRVEVPGTVSWTDTGVSLTAGKRFVVHASGGVSFIQGAAPVGPDGDTKPHPGVCVLPGDDHHAGLIGRISVSGIPFLVGSNFTGSTGRGGELFLGINDIGVANNGGAFTATIQVVQP